jgi:uncharacterized delta-60 repeat protein
MRGCVIGILLWTGAVISLPGALFAQEQWVYQYSGPGGGLDDAATSVVVGPDGNVYAAGCSEGIETLADFTIISLDPSGIERWVYCYDGTGDSLDRADAIAVGADGNLYAAGHSFGSGSLRDLTVISLTDSGVERWVYRYDGPVNGDDVATSIALGLDGSIYVAGWSWGIGSYTDFTVVSLTDSGVERWVYRYSSFPDRGDGAYSIAMGPDGNLYAAGGSWEDPTNFDFTVVSLTPSGSERWDYHYDGPAGTTDVARSIVIGSDGNLYATGYSTGSGTDYDFAVVSLTPSGGERWVYRYDGPGSTWDEPYAITMGLDSSIYVAGYSMGSGTDGDFTVVSLTDSGLERWVYRYDGPANRWDGAQSIIMGSDSIVYVAGYSEGNGPEGDFLVVSLSPDVGVQEGPNRPSIPGFRLLQNSPSPFHHSTVISYSLPLASEVSLCIYDITGRVVETLVNETQQPGIHQVPWNRKTNPSSVYFYELRAGEFVETRKMVVVD